MNSPTPGPGLVEWLALRRVARGGVAMAGGQCCDDGHPMPHELRKALPALIEAGLVVLAPVDVWGARRASLTTTGHLWHGDLTALNAQQTGRSHRAEGGPAPRPATATAHAPEQTAGRGAFSWAVSSFDDRFHALVPSSSIGRFVALCGLVLDSSVRVEPDPSGSRVCGTCTALTPGGVRGGGCRCD